MQDNSFHSNKLHLNAEEDDISLNKMWSQEHEKQSKHRDNKGAKKKIMSYLEGDSLLKEIEKSLEKKEEEDLDMEGDTFENNEDSES